ncbi:MAG: HesA/MoeB/ThiF family protein [Promethearchaeota archaeon]
MNFEDLNFFSRQKEIKWFSQEKISSITILILGVGGIGCNIALLTSRIGFKKIILIDCDVIEASNLNRQTLFSKNDIGKYKAEIAKNTLKNYNNLTSKIQAYNYDIFEDWQKTIKLIEECDYVMNGLDLPEIKRSLIGVLCLKLKKPMIYAGTDPHSGYSGMVLYQSSKKNEPCYECLQAIFNSIEDKNLITKYSQENILLHKNINWRELEKKDFQQLTSGATMIVTAMQASVLAVNILLHLIFFHDSPHRIIFDLFNDSIERYFLEKRENCIICSSDKHINA